MFFLDYFAFQRIPKDSYVFMRMPKDFNGFLWVPKDSNGIALDSIGIIKDS